jgi:AraC-like DNA-binding protein
MSVNQRKIHVEAVRSQARRIMELHIRYKVNVKDLAGRFECSTTLIQDILKKEKKKKSLVEHGLIM